MNAAPLPKTAHPVRRTSGFVLALRVIARNCRPAVTQPARPRARTALVSLKQRLRRKHLASARTAVVLAAELALQLLDLVLEARILADLTIDLADRVQHGGVIAVAEPPADLRQRP